MRKSAQQSGQAPKLCRHTSGQALLIVLLVMAVGLTIALSIVSRSVTDIRISQEEEESARAFSAAEAGIEESLRAGSATEVTLEGITARVTETGRGAGTSFVFEEPVDENEIQTIWLVGHDSDGNFDTGTTYDGDQIWLYWGNEGSGTGDGNCSSNPVPALEAAVIYDNGGFKLSRYAFDPDGTRATDCNRFDSSIEVGSFSLGGNDFNYRKTINLPSGTKYALRLRLLYNEEPHLLGVQAIGSGSLPAQGKCYESTATAPSGVTRKVRQCQSFPAPAATFDYVLFSGSDLTK
jgi:Tfp pilus assembly protein PilX